MRRRSLVLIGTTTALSLALIVPQVAQSAPAKDPRAQRAEVRAERARVASQIDTSKSSVAEIDAALSTIEANLATQQAALEKATADLDQADRDIASANTAAKKLRAEIGVLRSEMRDRAIQAYVRPTSEDLLRTLETSDFTTAAEQQFFVELRSQDDADLEDRLEGSEVDLAAQLALAKDAKERAAAARQKQSEQVVAVQEAQANQQTLLANAEATLNSQIQRSVELANTDAALSRQIAQQQAELAARIARARMQQEAQAKAEAAARARAAAQAKAPTATKPQTVAPNTPSPSAPTTAAPTTSPAPPVNSGGGSTPPTTAPYVPPVVTPPPVIVGPSVSVCNASGITVACAIVGQVNSMIAAARANGVTLTGSGYRDINRQIELRKKNCGTSYYAIWQMSAGSCRPPTAKPGSSQHEIGLAIDFNACNYTSTACHQWLKANAARFGFRNLPGEPWHWSTSGR